MTQDETFKDKQIKDTKLPLPSGQPSAKRKKYKFY